MRLPIDTSTVKFAAAGPAEPVLDFETRQPKTDEHGVPLFNVPVFAAGSGVKDSITIKVAGEVKGLSEFTIVKITNLIASWSQNEPPSIAGNSSTWCGLVLACRRS